MDYGQAISGFYLKAYFALGLILFGNWVKGTDTVEILLSGVRYSYPITASTVLVTSNDCSHPVEQYVKVVIEIPYNTSQTSYFFNISLTNTNK